jgi:hypothetical protein
MEALSICKKESGMMRTMFYGCLITIALVLHPFVALGDAQRRIGNTVRPGKAGQRELEVAMPS